MVELRSGGVEEWWSGVVEEWRSGGVAKWRGEGVEEYIQVRKIDFIKMTILLAYQM